MTELISSGSPFERKFGFSRAVIDGDMIYVAGTTGYDYQTMEMPEDVVEQAQNALTTIDNVLEEADSSLSDVLRVRYYLTDPADIEKVAPVLEEFFGSVRPAATMVIVQLIDPAMKIEVELTARKGAQHSQRP